VQGAICGLAVGTAQALTLRRSLGRIALAWPPALAAIWALGWAITYAAGIAVNDQVLHTWLGTIIGETIGYFLTAVFTVLVVRAVTRTCAPRWMAYLGYAAAAFIATGVLIPLGLDFARLVNFAGYVSWCSWLVAMAIVLWRNERQGRDADGRLRGLGTQSVRLIKNLFRTGRVSRTASPACHPRRNRG
jgi:hypothetical protein